VAVQFPPTAITAQTSDSVLSQVEVSHYAINVSDLQAPTIIESVRIRLVSVSSGQSLYDKVYKYEPQGDDLPLLPLLSDGRGRTIPRTLEALWAERLSIIFVGGNNVNAHRNLVSTPRHILISADSRENTRKRVEIDISYAENVLLPLRLEREFNWALSGWTPMDDMSHL